MKRHLVYLTALLLVLLTACGGSGNTASDAGEMEGQSTNTSVSTADTAGGAETFEEEPQAAGESRFQNAKLIHTAHLEVETTAFDAAAADLETLVGVRTRGIQRALKNVSVLGEETEDEYEHLCDR
mgnify:CR=1 FL=1